MNIVKKISLMLIGAVFQALPSIAQSRTNHLSVSVGALYERGVDATISWEHETKHHNTWEYFASGYVKWEDCESCGHVCPESFWKSYRNWLLGIAYKPCVTRGKNNHGNIRVGASFGSDTNDFVYVIDIGYQHYYALYKGVNVFWQVKTNIVPEGRDLFRTGVAVGLSIPLN